MKTEFSKEIDTVFSHNFEIDEEGLYAITVRASCKPGWRNSWWLKFKGLLEDILDLHLDDEDLQIEIDGIAFPKPQGKKGLLNSPAAFSGTKTIGKTKTVVIIIKLAKGAHQINFIPDGTPYLESLEMEPLTNPAKFIRYLNIQAEDENYYSWFTFTSVNLPLITISLTVRAGKLQGEADDDDLKIVINGEVQKNKNNTHTHSYFCGFTLQGKKNIFIKHLNLPESLHYLELLADKKPILQSVIIAFGKEPQLVFHDPQKLEEEFNLHYLLKDAAFLDRDTLSEDEVEKFLRNYGDGHPNHIYHKTIEGRKVSYWIKKFAFEAEINPKIILAKLQAEKGLITGSESINPTQEQLDWALGAGSTDEGKVGVYKGLYTQLRRTPYLIKRFFGELDKPPFTKEVDGRDITLVNKTTYAFYRYTPHIDGADLFYRVYSQFFGKDDLGGKI